ncbi:unnamed protein product [Auanema sp. JU1783]|nr:unnamed protein product [Auanema sp. JU1783]
MGNESLEEHPLLADSKEERAQPLNANRTRRSRIPGEAGQLIADVTSLHGKDHRIVFDRDRNVFEFQLMDGKLKHSVLYRLDELLTVKAHRIKISKGIPHLEDPKAVDTERIIYFYFVFKKNEHKWRVKEIPVTFITQQERNYWQTIILSTLKKIRNRPKNIIIFINPFGGKGKAKAIFERTTKPLFELIPGLKYEVFMTERANHARDYIMEMEPEKWSKLDGLVSVGGDGLFNELLSGGLIRTQRESGADIENPDASRLTTPHLRFGIIGAGSANSIVSTVHETNDCATAAVHIALGSECYVDVCTVHKDQSLLRISANAISYGWLGDVLRDSERYRCLGPIRYQWSALRTTVRHPTYKGKVSFSLSNKQTADPAKNLPPCLKPCALCEQGQAATTPGSPRYDYHWHTEFTHVICCVIPTVTPFTPYGLAPFTGIGDGTLDLSMVPRVSRCSNIQFMRKVAMYGGKGLYHLDPSLNCYRVVKWSYQPDQDQEEPGVWNLDGEILEQPPDKALHFRLHPQLISFFGRDEAMIEPSKRSIIKKRKSSIVYK